ncbi:hypothetical protein G7Z17_g4202 [Cylindrodendrum hubeiense]|uniref:Uncharacterized protein n=1 Tax=Cylindrodendrum hubeiense TaxID=595255 RepID=A0A9P5HJJ5_9HYPO|nr:hypothetical protein G7Z17_g4202 [Cylindrodendrum hubeiense]
MRIRPTSTIQRRLFPAFMQVSLLVTPPESNFKVVVYKDEQVERMPDTSSLAIHHEALCLLFAPFALLATLASAVAIRDATTIPHGTDKVIKSTTFKGRPFIQSTCKVDDSVLTSRNVKDESVLTKRNLDICGAPCTTYCNGGTGGPNPNDCTAIATAMENNGGFLIPQGDMVIYSLGSCQTYVINTDNQDLFYCSDQSNWAGVINYVAWNCQASSPGGPYNGGSCHFYDNTGIGWVQVQTV